MYKRVPGISSLIFLSGLGLLFSLLLTAGDAPAKENKKGAARAAAPTPTSAPEIIFTGKLFCSLKRPVILPFKGTVTSLRVRSGQRVEAGELLASYRLSPEAAIQLRRRLAPPQIKELELKLAEVERSLAVLEGKQREVNQLAREKLAPDQSKTQINRELQLLARQRAAVQERLNQERQLAQDDRALLQKYLGNSFQSGQLPLEAALTAPISGYIIQVHPEMREGAELEAPTPVFMVGVMDPMLIRAQAFETEAAQLRVGDVAEVTLESLPSRTLEARVTRLSWAPLTAALEQPSYYEVELQVPNPDLSLKEGLKCRIVVRPSK